MARVFKTASSHSFPEWVDEKDIVKSTVSSVGKNDLKRISSLQNLDDEKLVAELDVIEQKASEKQVYYYNASWNKEAKSNIREYGDVCGCETVEIDFEDPKVRAYASSQDEEETMNKESSSEHEEAGYQIPFDMIDAFKLDQKGDDSHLKRADWEKVSSESKMSSPDVIKMSSSSIIRLDSNSEDNSISPHMPQRPGQNSVLNPDAIGELKNSESQDNGEMIRKQNKNIKEEREAKRKLYEKEEKQRAEDLGYGSLPKGNVRRAEAQYANPGIKKEDPFPKKNEVADFTEGEKLKSIADSRKSDIQREKQEDTSWDSVEANRQSEVGISEIFAESLKKQLSKNG